MSFGNVKGFQTLQMVIRLGPVSVTARLHILSSMLESVKANLKTNRSDYLRSAT